MFAALRARQPGASIWRIAWWHLLHTVCYMWVSTCYQYRVWGLHNIPRTGPVLLVSNHQSFLDPILVGVGSHHRQFYALARSTLFANPFFSALIRSLNAIPVERNTSDTAAMRRCVDMLKQNNALLVFPEGTRTSDGQVGEFQSGILLLAKRADATVVPVAIEGAFDIWGKNRKLPRAAGRIGVRFGPAISAKELTAMKPDMAMGSLHDAVESMRRQIAEQIKPTAMISQAAPVTPLKPVHKPCPDSKDLIQ